MSRGDPVAGTHKHLLWNMGPQHKRVYARLLRAMRGDDRDTLVAAAGAISMRRGLPEKIGVHDPPLLSLGFASDPLDLVHAPLQVARHENLIVGSDVGPPVDVDLRVADGLERTFSVEHHNDIIAMIGQPLR